MGITSRNDNRANVNRQHCLTMNNWPFFYFVIIDKLVLGVSAIRSLFRSLNGICTKVDQVSVLNYTTSGKTRPLAVPSCSAHFGEFKIFPIKAYIWWFYVPGSDLYFTSRYPCLFLPGAYVTKHFVRPDVRNFGDLRTICADPPSFQCYEQIYECPTRKCPEKIYESRRCVNFVRTGHFEIGGFRKCLFLYKFVWKKPNFHDMNHSVLGKKDYFWHFAHKC